MIISTIFFCFVSIASLPKCARVAQGLLHLQEHCALHEPPPLGLPRQLHVEEGGEVTLASVQGHNGEWQGHPVPGCQRGQVPQVCP